MCGRFALIERFEVLKTYYDAIGELEWQANYNVAPTQQVPVVLEEGGARTIRLMRWGLIPHWAKTPKPIINARAETVAENGAFKDSFKARRCIVPASGFYEWKKPAVEPYYFTPKEGFFSFSGIWSQWRTPDGVSLETFSIITTTANEVVSPVHERMPVVLGGNAVGEWMNQQATANDLKALLQQFPAGLMAARAVSKYVNSPKNSGSQCIQQVNST